MSGRGAGRLPPKPALPKAARSDLYAGNARQLTRCENFIDFVDRLTRLGCPGLEDWQWLPYTMSPTSGLQPEGEVAQAWQGTTGAGGGLRQYLADPWQGEAVKS